MLVVLYGHDSSRANLTADTRLNVRAFTNSNKTVLATDLLLTDAATTGPWAAAADLTNQWAAQAIALRRR